MPMSRYEEILIRMVAAQINAGFEPVMAAESLELRKAATLLESYLQARTGSVMSWDNTPAPLKPLKPQAG